MPNEIERNVVYTVTSHCTNYRSSAKLNCKESGISGQATGAAGEAREQIAPGKEDRGERNISGKISPVKDSKAHRGENAEGKADIEHWEDEPKEEYGKDSEGKERQAKEREMVPPVLAPGQTDVMQILEAASQPQAAKQSEGDGKKAAGKNPYTRQQEMDFDSVKSGNQVGAAANNRVAVMDSLETYATDGFDSYHNEVEEDIGAKEENPDDIDAILRAEEGKDTGLECGLMPEGGTNPCHGKDLDGLEDSLGM